MNADFAGSSTCTTAALQLSYKAVLIKDRGYLLQGWVGLNPILNVYQTFNMTENEMMPSLKKKRSSFYKNWSSVL